MSEVFQAALPGLDDCGPGSDLLSQWARGKTRRVTEAAVGGLRFAFYGRCSTEDHQDPETSRSWQVLRAQATIAGAGRIVEKFFDVGVSRVHSWPARPEAARLLAALADPDRGFDAIVIGAHERAFYGNQYTLIAPVFAHYGVQLWMPELGGAVDPSIASVEELLVLLGILAKREVDRSRARTLASMTVQVREQGRFQGGRPPYGYLLVDAGRHPNRSRAADGKRLQRLHPDSATGPVVTWMFQMRLEGRSTARIARALNDAGIPCPSAADAERNRHRAGGGWALRTVSEILANPAYTGRQIWGRSRTDHDLIDPSNAGLGHRDVVRPNAPDEWVISDAGAHPGLVSEADFVAVQGMRAARADAVHAYLLTGMLRCGLCGRRFTGHWVNNVPGYRCRHGQTSAAAPDPERDKYTYLREGRILAKLPLLHHRLNADTAEPEQAQGGATAIAVKKPVTVTPEEVIDYLRGRSLALTYDPRTRTLGSGDEHQARITI